MHLLNIKKQSASEVQYFVTEFNETFEKLKVNVLKEASCKLRLNQLKREEMESYIAQHRPIPEDIYSTICFDGYQRQFPETMKLFKFALLIPSSTANVERGFSTMKLLISPSRTSLGEKNFNRIRRVCLDGPENFSDKTIEKLINAFITTERHIDLQCIDYFPVYASVIMVISLRSFIIKRKLLCLLYLNIIHFIWIIHFHLLFSYSYSIILFLYIFVVDLSLQLKAVDLIKMCLSSSDVCVYVKEKNLTEAKKRALTIISKFRENS